MPMRTLSAVCAILATIALSSPASAQDAEHRTLVKAFIARGQALGWLRGVLDHVTAREPGARPEEFQLSVATVGDRGSIHVFRFLPTPPGVVSTEHHRYHAAIAADSVQTPERVENYDLPPNDNISSTSFVEAPIFSASLNGVVLGEIEQAWEAVRRRYDSRLRLSNVLVSYTSVRSTGGHDTMSSYAVIVFTTPNDAAGGYTALTRTGTVERTYQGVVESDGWLNRQYWLDLR